MSIPILSGVAGAYLDDGYHVDVCERTETVRDVIVEASSASACEDVAPLHLRDITELDLSGQEISALSLGDFKGLHRLETLDLSGNSLTSLPAELFDNLFLLKELRLHDNQLATLPKELFDKLFLLEKLTLHDNTMETLPEGMFGDLSRFNGLLDGENVTGVDRIRQFLAEHELETVEGFIDALPELHKERFVFVYDSSALGAEFVSSEHPRVISWGADARFVFAWQTNPDASDMFRNSVEFLVPGETQWTAGLIDFSGDAPEIVHPENCQTCHGSESKPLWPGLFWEGAEGSPVSSLSTGEMEDAMRSLLASTDSRIAPLDLEGSDFTMGLANRVFQGYNGMVSYLWPAEQLSIHLSLRHAEILLERLKQRNDYVALAEEAVCASNPTGAAGVVTAPFRESRDHTLGLLPFSDSLAMSGGIRASNYEYNFNSGTMDGNLLFLLMNDMWETHPEVRQIYRATSNIDAVQVNRVPAEWYLAYPGGQATAEDELIQLRRLYFGHGNQYSLAGVEEANYAFGELATGGQNRTNQHTVMFTEAQVNSMLPKVCQALKKKRLGGANLPDGLEIAGETSFTVSEGQMPVATLRATNEGQEATDLMWWTSGGADESKFRIDRSGALSFTAPRNFEAPYDADGDGVYEVSVEVSDGQRGGSTDLTVSLSDVNEAPTADAGPDQRDIAEAASVTLSGTGADPDTGEVLSYGWTQTSGDAVVLSDSSAATPNFTAPSDLTADTTLRFTLRVTDDEGLYTEDSVAVTVKRDPFSAIATDAPESHDGSTSFTFELRFSEAPNRHLSRRVLEYYTFEVTGGVVERARRLETNKNLRWQITIRPDGSGDVTVVLPAETSCVFADAICTSEGRMLSQGFEIVIPASSTQQNAPAAGEPSISGTAQVGQTLTASTTDTSDADGMTNATFTYQWLADDAEISGATGVSYTLVEADEGRTIKVRVSFTDDQGNAETLTSAATAAVTERPNTTATGEPTISGTAQVGETLAAATSGISDDDGLKNVYYAYQWLADDAEISRATAGSYTLVEADEGRTIKVRVSFTDDHGNAETLTSAATAAVELAVAESPNNTATGEPTISGTAQVGETLAAETSGISDDDGMSIVYYTYQWLADDADIDGATGSSYSLVEADEGRAIKVRVSFTDDRGNAETLTSVATAAVVEEEEVIPLTATTFDAPTSHDGSNTFTFELRFSEEFPLSYKTLQDNAFTITGGDVVKAWRLNPPDNVRWGITVEPDGNGAVTIVLPETTDCEANGAICAGEAKMLSQGFEFEVAGLSAPEITSGSSFSVDEGATQVATLMATDGDTPAADLTWSVSGGDDEAKFALTAAGVLSFAAARDYETLDDADTDGVYQVTVQVSDGGRTASADLTVTLANVNEAPTADAGADQENVAQGDTVTLNGSGADPDAGEAFSFAWVQTSGATVTLSGTAAASPNFTAPTGQTSDVELIFTLRVTDDEGLFAEDTVTVTINGQLPLDPLTASAHGVPAPHDGSATFTFELRFSEEPADGFSYKTLRDHAFTVTGGEVMKARRLEQGKNVRWEISVTPDGDGTVTIVLPVTTDCGATGAVCTDDGRMLSSRLEVTVPGP